MPAQGASTVRAGLLMQAITDRRPPQASRIKTPTREDLAKVDKSRKNKASNKDWTNPHDPDAKITQMTDGRTHLRHHGNILKRLLVHVPGFNLGLVMRALFGIGKPRGLQDGPAAAILAVLNVILRAVGSLWSRWDRFCRIPTSPTTEITHSPAR